MCVCGGYITREETQVSKWLSAYAKQQKALKKWENTFECEERRNMKV